MRQTIQKQFILIVTILLSLFVVLISIKQIHSPLKVIDTKKNVQCTEYNNYIIFKNSAQHFLDKNNLYQPYPEKQWDLFKYTPTFSLLFTPIALLPNSAGLSLWNLINLLTLIGAIYFLPHLNQTQKLWFIVAILPETYISILNEQSNALIAGLALWSFIALEKNQMVKASILISITSIIKLFGVFFFAMLPFYPKLVKNTMIAMLCLFLLLCFPLLYWSPKEYLSQLEAYLHLLKNDHGEYLKFSIMAWLQNWFHISPPKNIIVIIGLLVQFIPALLPLIKKTNVSLQYRSIYLASWLIWVVIFNHMAESPTFVIAVCGVILWYFFQTSLNSKLAMALILFCIVFTSLGPSDLFPKNIRPILMEKMQLKVFPCILVWITIQVQWVQYYFKKNHEI